MDRQLTKYKSWVILACIHEEFKFNWSWSCYRTSSTSAWFCILLWAWLWWHAATRLPEQASVVPSAKTFRKSGEFQSWQKSRTIFGLIFKAKIRSCYERTSKTMEFNEASDCQWLITRPASQVTFSVAENDGGSQRRRLWIFPRAKARRLALSRHDDVVNPIVNHAQSYHTWVAKTIKHIFKTIPGLGGYCWVYHIIQVDFTWNMSNMHYLFLREMSLRYLPGNSINPPDKVWISLAETQKVRSPLDKSRQEVH